MIDVAQYKTEISRIPGDILVVPRSQMTELLAEVEAGQAAKRTLRRISTIANLSSTTAIAA